jgi:hypothetical protein
VAGTIEFTYWPCLSACYKSIGKVLPLAADWHARNVHIEKVIILLIFFCLGPCPRKSPFEWMELPL